MKKIDYNLAATRRIHGPIFALRTSVFVVVSLLLAGVALFNLLGQHEKNRAEQNEARRLAQRVEHMGRESQRLGQEIAAWKSSWQAELAAANILIDRKAFSFVARLDFLERIWSPGIHVRHLSLVNGTAGQVVMTISSRSLKELFALYKKLAPYGLVIASETQTLEETQVNLIFKIANEKI